jgi:hypothetical protein
MLDWPGLVGQIQLQLLALIPASGHRVREHDVFLFYNFLLYTNCIGLAAFFPNKPSYCNNTYEEEETPHGTTYNGSDVGGLTLRCRSRI